MYNITNAFHGLEAYSGKNKNIYRLINQAKTIDSINSQISTSDKLVGDIGVLVSAIHTEAYNGDCWSVVENGRRYAGEGRATLSYDDCNGISADILIEYSEMAIGYCEFFAHNPTVNAIVVKVQASAYQKKRARVLARALKLPLFEVHKDSFKNFVHAE